MTSSPAKPKPLSRALRVLRQAGFSSLWRAFLSDCLVLPSLCLPFFLALDFSRSNDALLDLILSTGELVLSIVITDEGSALMRRFTQPAATSETLRAAVACGSPRGFPGDAVAAREGWRPLHCAHSRQLHLRHIRVIVCAGLELCADGEVVQEDLQLNCAAVQFLSVSTPAWAPAASANTKKTRRTICRHAASRRRRGNCRGHQLPGLFG